MNTPRHIMRLLYLLSLIAVCSASTIPLQRAGAQATNERSRIAFVTVDYDTRTMMLNLVDPDSGAVTPLVKDAFFYFPVLSPDGRYVAFLGEHPMNKRCNVYVIGTDGSNLHALIPYKPRSLFTPDGKVAWSPDSTQIVYGVLNASGQPTGFFRVGLDGVDPLRLHFDIPDPLLYSRITASPDGSRFAVVVSTDTNPYGQLYIIDADGNNAQAITSVMDSGEPFEELAWSPDGQHTLLTVNSAFVPEPRPLMQADGDGANAEVLIAPPPNYITSTSWSPDSSRITFLATEMGASGIPDGEVYVANADGSGVRALNIPTNVGYLGTSWSVIPDDIVLPDAPISFLEVVG